MPHDVKNKGSTSSPRNGLKQPELDFIASLIAGVSDKTPEIPDKEGKKSADKTPDKTDPEDTSPHKKTKTPDPPPIIPVAVVIFLPGAGGPKDPDDPDDPKEPKKDPPGPPSPGGGGAPPPPADPTGTQPDPKKKKMGANRPSIKDVPLYKEGDNPIAFVTSFTSYLNYYNIDPMTKILKAGDVGFVSV